MKNIRWSMVIILALAILALTAFSVMAAPQAQVIEACAVGDISGTVVAVDPEENIVTIYTEEGNSCTVTLNGSYDHPIVSLLGKHFGDINADSLLEALDGIDTETCAVQDTFGNWSWQPVGECLGETVTVLSTDVDGNVVAITSEDIIIEFLTNSDFASQISDELLVEWTVDLDGDLVQVSDQIAIYHADGMGFGVLVKLYAIAESMGMDVNDLVIEFQSGKGMGQIFKEYGKPSKTGVGHVRHDKDKNGNGPPQEDPDDGDQPEQKNNIKKPKPQKQNKGVCKPKPNKGKAKGRPGC